MRCSRWALGRIRMAMAIVLLLPLLAGASSDLPVLSVGEARPAVEIAPNSEYFLDSTHALTYEEIMREPPPFRRHHRDSFRFSFEKATLWIRCRIASGADSGKSPAAGPVLAMANPILGAVTLHVPVIRDGAPGLVVMRGGGGKGPPPRRCHSFIPPSRFPIIWTRDGRC